MSKVEDKMFDDTKTVIKMSDESQSFLRGKNANKEKEQWANVEGQYLLSPILGGDGRLLVLEDPFKSQYDCSACFGKGHTEEICPRCLGTKYHHGKEENGECPDCTVGTSDARKTYGKVLCTVCSGKGGTIIVPDDKKINTTTGDVLAISRDGIRQVKIGDKVLFTNYTGSPFKFLKKDLRVMHEKDLLCVVKQLKRTTEGLTEGSFADVENVGIAHE